MMNEGAPLCVGGWRRILERFPLQRRASRKSMTFFTPNGRAEAAGKSRMKKSGKRCQTAL
jgi:hypothetical protein